MKNNNRNCVERLSKAEADLEEAREMLNYSILERVRLEKQLEWLAHKCAMLDDGLSGTDANGYRELARKATGQ